MSENFRFKSKRTNYYVTSTIYDRVGSVISTRNGANSVPENSVRGPVAYCQISVSESFSSSKLIFFFLGGGSRF